MCIMSTALNVLHACIYTLLIYLEWLTNATIFARLAAETKFLKIKQLAFLIWVMVYICHSYNRGLECLNVFLSSQHKPWHFCMHPLWDEKRDTASPVVSQKISLRPRWFCSVTLRTAQTLNPHATFNSAPHPRCQAGRYFQPFGIPPQSCFINIHEHPLSFPHTHLLWQLWQLHSSEL